MDFSLSAPSPSAVTVFPGATSATESLTISASGAFDESVVLSCADLPAGASCVFRPLNTISPTANNPVSVALNIETASTTPAGNFQITISAAVSGGPTKTQTLNLVVSAAVDYALAISNPSLTAQLNNAAVFDGTLASVNGYNSAVALTCGSGAPSSCVVSPSSATPTTAGVAFTVTASSGAAQTYSFNINAVGSDPSKVAHSAAVSLIVLPAQNFDFAVSATPTSASVPVGQTALFTVGVSPNTGSFPIAVTFSCTNLPNLSTCTFNPSQVGAGSGNSTVALTITTTAPGHAMVSTVSALLLFPLWSWFLIPRRRHREAWRSPIALAVVLLAIFWAACGGGLQGGSSGGSGNPGTQKGTYQITISAASGSVSHTAQVSLTVK